MIAREGLHLILIGLVLTAGLVIAAARYDSKTLFVASLILGVLTIFTTFFFRDPVRGALSENGILLAPADGRILSVDTCDQFDFVGGQATRVSIFLSIFDVHVNRVPASGTVEHVNYNPGKFFQAFKEKASSENEQTEIGMVTDSGHRIVFKQIAGLIARRIACHLKPGDRVAAGERFGIIRFGSRAELIVPAGSSIKARVGDHVKAGKTVIGYLPVGNQTPRLKDNASGQNVEI